MSTKEVFIIAEIGSVHDGSFGNACKLIEAAANTGANAVKFQTHMAEAETLNNAPSPSYFSSEPRYDYFNRTSFSLNQWKELKLIADSNNIEFMSSPFSNESVDLLEEIGIDIYKIPSGEVTNDYMLEKISKLKKDIILSSGMSSWDELDHAVEVVIAANSISKLSVLQCTSHYPCPPDKIGLNIMGEIRERYNVQTGLSDHSIGLAAPFAAVSLGASIIEKHFTFSKLMYGSDAIHSMEPSDFTKMVNGIREIETMLRKQTNKDKIISEFTDMENIFEKSIVSICDIPPFSVIDKNMIGIKKPGSGIPPK